MQPAVLATSQLYDPVDETLVTYLRLFTRDFSNRLLLQIKTSKICYEETGFSAFYFRKSFSSEVELSLVVS